MFNLHAILKNYSLCIRQPYSISIVLPQEVSASHMLEFHINKACPVAARQKEDVAAACERELFEESGVKAHGGRFLGESDANFEKQVWGFHLMEFSEELSDGGGLVFRFFWQSLDGKLDDDWRPLFKCAVDFIKRALTKDSTGLADVRPSA